MPAYNDQVPDQFVTCNLEDIVVGEALPTALYLYIDFRFITFRAEGDLVDRLAYDRLLFKGVRNLFVMEKDRDRFIAWSQARNADLVSSPSSNPETRDFTKVREDVHRKTMDIFQATHPDKIVAQTLSSSKKLVAEVMKFPYAVAPLSQLHTFSRGTVDHSVNVSILSVYLAMQMGYSHQLILQHVGMGGLLHDIGKPKVAIDDGDPPELISTKMRDHSVLGSGILEAQPKVPNEVKMIIAQHHECFDGSGYPKKLRGNAIYDLARIVAIANQFDELVGDGNGSLLERQREAIKQLDEVYFRRFDPQKLDKTLRILKMGV